MQRPIEVIDISRIHRDHRLALDCLNIRVFTLLPGVVVNHRSPQYKPFAKDRPDLVVMMSLWLGHGKFDFLRGQLMSVNRDSKER